MSDLVARARAALRGLRIMDPWLSFLFGFAFGIFAFATVDGVMDAYCPHGCELRFEQLTPEARHD